MVATYSYLPRNLKIEQIASDQLRDNRSDAELMILLMPKDIRMDGHVLTLNTELHR